MVRDLLSGPKRFTDLMDRLGGITPKTLTQRLRELEESGLVAVDRQRHRGAQPVGSAARLAPTEVTITTTVQGLTALIFTGSDAAVTITGDPAPVRRFRHLVRTTATVVTAT